jgi:hypothetical protein
LVAAATFPVDSPPACDWLRGSSIAVSRPVDCSPSLSSLCRADRQTNRQTDRQTDRV